MPLRNSEAMNELPRICANITASRKICDRVSWCACISNSGAGVVCGIHYLPRHWRIILAAHRGTKPWSHCIFFPLGSLVDRTPRKLYSPPWLERHAFRLRAWVTLLHCVSEAGKFWQRSSRSAELVSPRSRKLSYGLISRQRSRVLKMVRYGRWALLRPVSLLIWGWENSYPPAGVGLVLDSVQ